MILHSFAEEFVKQILILDLFNCFCIFLGMQAVSLLNILKLHVALGNIKDELCLLGSLS